MGCPDRSTATTVPKGETRVPHQEDQHDRDPGRRPGRDDRLYVDKLGFQKRTDIPFGNGYRWVEVGPEDTETTIALAPPPEGNPTGGRETGIGLETGEIDEFHAELKAAGVDVDAEVSRMGGPVPPLFWLRDPEGNTLMVVG